MTAQREDGHKVTTQEEHKSRVNPREEKIIRVTWLPSSSEDESDIRNETKEEIGESQVSEMYLEG